MSNPLKKIEKNAAKYRLDELYKRMTPEMYKEGIRKAVEHTAEDLGKEYEKQMVKMRDDYNNSIREGITMAMDTVAIEIIYELGNVLNCYVEEPEFLDQKVEIVQNIYEKAMDNIKEYAKYKTDNQAQRVYEKKKKLVEKTFNIYQDNTH